MRSDELGRVARAFTRAAELQAERERVAALTKSAAPALRQVAREQTVSTDDARLWYLRQLELALEYDRAMDQRDFSRFRFYSDGRHKMLLPG